MRKVHSQSKIASKLTVVHISQILQQFKWYASLWDMLNAINFRTCKRLFENPFFCLKISRQIFLTKQKCVGWWKNAVSSRFFIAKPLLGCHTWSITAKEVQQKNTCLLKKLGFSIIFAKNWPAKNFWPAKILAPVNYYLVNAAKQ